MHAKIAKSQNRKVNKNAFTLSEVLITLMVIGVVAALAIPALLTTTNEAEYKSLYKKAYANASQAINSAIAENSLYFRPSGLCIEKRYNFDIFKSKFIVTKECFSSNNADCWTSGELVNGSPTADAPAFIDNSGMVWSLRQDGIQYSYILVDTNGAKNPNQFGKDRFIFTVPNKNHVPGTGFAVADHADAPAKVAVFRDASVVSGWCPSPPCYYTSWLLN